MPNYGLVVNPQYNPMSYDDYAKPFEQYAKVYEQMADKYDALETTASDMEKLALNAADAEQYAIYMKYANDLRAAASDLANNGLSTKTRGTVSNLMQRYMKEIKPISTAWDRRQELADEQRKLNPNGTKIYDIDYGNGSVGVGYLMKNPSAGYRTIDLPDVTKRVAEVMSNYKSVLINSGQWGNSGISGIFERIERYGLTPEDIDNITNPNSEDYNNPLYQQIREVVQREYDNTGVDSWGDETKSSQVRNAALQGVQWGLGTSKPQNIQDPWMPYYIWKKQQKEEVPALENPEKIWDFVGTDIYVNPENDDEVIKEHNENVKLLEKVISEGESVLEPQSATIPLYERNKFFVGHASATTGLISSTSENVATNAKESTENKTRYEKLIKKYAELGITDINEILKMERTAYDNAVDSRVVANRWTTLNSATNARTMNLYIADNLTSGVDADKLKSQVTKGKNKEKLNNNDYDNLIKALSEESTRIQINYNSGKVRIHNTKYGDFNISSTVFHNLNVPLYGNFVPGDTYINIISELYNSGQLNEDAMHLAINNFYTILLTNSRQMVQEPSKTSSKTQQ